MKHITTLLVLSPALAIGQSLVSTLPENRTALLEDFTGIHCGYCPEGHVIAAALEAALKDRFVVVGNHSGGYAVPGAGEPDFRTTEGAAIDAFYTIGGYPAGVINRHIFNGANDLGRGLWEASVNEMLALPSPVNVGVESSFDIGTQQLTVHVHALYTADSPSGNDYLSVLVKENHIVGWQTDYANGNQPNYDHTNVLRHYLTDTWGEDVGNHVAGETVDRTYVYTVPSTWVMDNCVVVAHVGEYQSEVYQAREVAAIGGSTLVIGNLQGDAQPYRGGVSGTLTAFSNSFTNGVGVDEQYLVTLVSTDQPAGWTASFNINGTDYISTATVMINNGATSAIHVNITPNSAAGIGNYQLAVASVNNPGAPLLEQDFHVISGVHDLIVTNPQAEPHDVLYVDGLISANENARAKTSRTDYLNFNAAAALTGVNNLYMNISWTFPSYTDEVANALATFMYGGGNVMIAGQDIGWDQSGSTGSYGTPVTQAFYTNELMATFVSDGTPTTTTVDFDDADLVFGTVPNSTINTVFGTMAIYPDHFTPIAPAVAIMHYNDNGIGGLRVQTTGKVVYFGVGPEQMSDVNVAHSMVQLSHDWFYGLVSVQEFDAAMNALGQAYPSPANEHVTLPLGTLKSNASLDVFDATGRVVLSTTVRAFTPQVELDTRALSNGFYSVRLLKADGTGEARSFEVGR